MATLKDVAEKVGVSITTVSRVMNGRGAISRETRDKVFAAMKELNYFPNEMARSLGNKSSHLIGLIVPYIDHAFFGILTAAIEEACYKSGYKLFSAHPAETQIESVSFLRCCVRTMLQAFWFAAVLRMNLCICRRMYRSLPLNA